MRPDVAELARQGVAVIVATRDADLRPAVGRGWGPLLSDDGARLTLAVEVAEGTALEADLRGGSPLAVTMSLPSSYLTVQLKGAVVDLCEPTEEDLRRVEEHLGAFVEETGRLGVDESIIRALTADRLLTAVLDVTERYDQTPGPGAGRPL